MFSHCTRKLAFRWGLLASILLAGGVVIYWLFGGYMPANDSIWLTNMGEQWSLPFSVPRLMDALFLFPQVWIMAALCLAWRNVGERFCTEQKFFGHALSWGIPIGALVAVICGWGLVNNMWLGALIALGCIWSYQLGRIDYDTAVWRHWFTLTIMALTCSIILTVAVGTVVGLVVGLGFLLCASVVYIIGVASFELAYRCWPHFRRRMIDCEVSG